ncbi:MAG: GNAT family N-acetyltransferase, partial [Pseudomonadota bacterium]
MDAFEQLFIHLDLQLNNIRLVPLSFEHEQGLAEACRDGELWNLRITSTPHYTEVKNYIEKALIQKAQGSRYPFVVIE